MTRLSILLIDCDSIRTAERRKAERLASRAETDVHLLVPHRYAGLPLRLEPGEPVGYRLTVGRLVGRAPARTLFLDGLAAALREKPDVVHVTSDEPFLLTAQVARAARRHAPDSIFTFHSWGNLLFTRRVHPQRLSLLYEIDTRLEAGVFRRAAGAAIRNREAGRVLRARGFRGRIAYIPWGTDVETMERGRRGRGRERFGLSGRVIGYLGRLTPEKGVGDLIDACLTLGGETTLAVAGEGPMKSVLAERAQREGAKLTLRLLGNLPHDGVPDFLASLDALALPSRTTRLWSEQFGRVLVEAMAAGTPVVGSSSGAIPEVIGDAGLVFPEGDAAALAEALAGIAADAQLRDRLAAAGRARAKAEFGWEAFASRSVAFFRSLRGEATAGDAFEEFA